MKSYIESIDHFLAVTDSAVMAVILHLGELILGDNKCVILNTEPELRNNQAVQIIKVDCCSAVELNVRSAVLRRNQISQGIEQCLHELNIILRAQDKLRCLK